ncbi:hypothetical protein LMG28138_02985 [Pararobbsia alpina]|uniref:Uncharacterized protein n=1 Tax=Pararobbsia alpina TaxID=621374 RepID=A0A6S7CXB3_9BURK|nr:hypothetical protein LMG28138_02985 [Pararobbsia alpina]
MGGAGVFGAQLLEHEHGRRAIGNRCRDADKTALANLEFDCDGGLQGVGGQGAQRELMSGFSSTGFG